MKAILLFLLIGLTLSYSTSDAISYANRYCGTYNSAYNKYDGKDCANFVSQCMHAGGFSMKDCAGKDNKGMIIGVSNLKACLKQHKWKHSTTRPSAFKKGYPLFMNAYGHAMLATKINSGSVSYAGHTNDRCGDVTISSGVTYYYM